MRALISVYDKTGVVDFAKGLEDLGWEIISTGGTYNLLKENGIDVISVEDITGFPEILDGRVKTLNPKIHGGILYKRDNKDHVSTLDDHDIGSIDMVVNSLYPFEETLKNTDDMSEIIEMIDIGGPSMIRAAAKNFEDVIILTDSDDYDNVLSKLKDDSLDIEDKKSLAAKAFKTTFKYDKLICQYLLGKDAEDEDDDELELEFENKKTLRYGENPHQSAAYYEYEDMDPKYIADLKQHHGKELSYNNYNDMFGAIKAVKNFKDIACVAVKHSNPCGMGTGDSVYDAYMKAYKCDTESIFGGIIAFNQEVDLKTAEEMSKIFLEIIVAPSFSDEAFELISQKKNIRLMTIENFDDFEIPRMEFRGTINGILTQDYDSMEVDSTTWDFPSKRKPTGDELGEMIFAWQAVKAVASNGVVLTKDGGTVGIGQGQTKRSWAVENALDRAIDLDGAVMASDAFFFEDTVELLAEYGIKAVIQPGGSISDPKVVEACDKHDIALVFTGNRHFRH